MHESMGESDQFMRQVPVKVQGEGIPSIAAINLKGFCQYPIQPCGISYQANPLSALEFSEPSNEIIIIYTTHFLLSQQSLSVYILHFPTGCRSIVSYLVHGR